MMGGRALLVLLVSALLVQIRASDPLLYESFDEDFKGRWTVSSKGDYQGVWKHAKSDGHEDYGLLVSEPARKYAIIKELEKPVTLKDGTTVLQFEVRLQNGLECGGAYLKYIRPQEAGWDAKEFDNETPYTIMFGPDKCGSTNKVHFILKHKNPKTGKYVEHHLKSPPSVPYDKLSHVYTAILKPNNDVTILIDGEKKKEANFLSADDFEPALIPSKTIPDPDDRKPEDWDERAKIPDPNAVKPDDWDEDAPMEIVDEEATKPEGWLPELKKKASAFVSPTPPPSSVSSLLPSIPAALDLSDASQAWFRRALGVQVSRSPTKRGDPVLPPALVLQYAEFLRMAAAISQHGLVVSSRSHHWDAKDSRFQKRMGNGRLVSTGICCSGSRKARLVCASGTPSSVMQPVQLPSDGDRGQSPKKSSESSLTLIRHGESLWNEKNLFTGCVDVPLTPKGVEEAIEAGKRICNIPIDMIYTSSLIRAQMTAMLAMMQRRRKKIPVIMHNESEQAHRWSQIYSEETLKQSIPVITAWQLNERMYGELQGLNKQETANLFGTEQVHEWRRSYDIPPPNGESLEMCAERAVAYFKEQIVPQLVAGKHVMVAAHGNSLRSIIMHLDKLTSQEVISLELSTGIPMLYIFKEGRFIRRGSPVGPSEASVYAYTKTLAKYRQKLDSMIQ